MAWVILRKVFSVVAPFGDLLILSIALIVMTILYQVLGMNCFQAKPSTTKAENIQTLASGALVITAMAMLFGGLALIGFDGSSPGGLEKDRVVQRRLRARKLDVFQGKKNTRSNEP